MRNSTEIFYTVILATIFFMVMIAVVVTAVWRYYNRKRAHEKTLMEFDHTLLQSRLEIQEETFKSISRELHDNMGQILTLAKLHLNTLALEDTEQSRERLNGAIDMITQTIQSLRDVSKNLHADTISKNGLVPALETEIRIIEKLGILHPVFRVSGQPVHLDDNKSLIIFRIVQEALQNVVKHAKATVLEMNIDFLREQMKLTISDNGTGFNWEENKDKGSGLRNMTDRARIIGAHFDMQPAGDTGTIITLTIPTS
jgi:two-component system, NarL family, sensor kinase